jgi:hypothetical protein
MMQHEGRGHGRMDSAKWHERMQERMQERRAKRMAAFKQKLQITPSQESAWNTFTAALQPARMQRPDRAEFAKLSTPERIDRMRSMRTARMAEMDKRADATKAFYAVLAPEQKKVFDDTASRMMGHGKRGHGHHARHHHGRHHHGDGRI